MNPFLEEKKKALNEEYYKKHLDREQPFRRAIKELNKLSFFYSVASCSSHMLTKLHIHVEAVEFLDKHPEIGLFLKTKRKPKMTTTQLRKLLEGKSDKESKEIYDQYLFSEGYGKYKVADKNKAIIKTAFLRFRINVDYPLIKEFVNEFEAIVRRHDLRFNKVDYDKSKCYKEFSLVYEAEKDDNLIYTRVGGLGTDTYITSKKYAKGLMKRWKSFWEKIYKLAKQYSKSII